MPELEIPPVLVKQAQEGNIVLFLGSGASIGATHPQGKTPPTSTRLVEAICDEFLDNSFRSMSLASVSELAISESNLVRFQQFIVSIFEDFRPARFHKLIPLLPWAAIVTTNFDLIIERAYQSVENRVQSLAVFLRDGEPIEPKLRVPGTIPYLKLHGCITMTADPEVPLILTPEQYLTHKKKRERLFERTYSYMCDYPTVFAGQSLNDSDLRYMLMTLTARDDVRPRYYLVVPGLTAAEQRFWSSKRFTYIDSTFEQFIDTLHATVPASFRHVFAFTQPADHPLFSKFKTNANPKQISSLLSHLERDVTFVHSGLSTPTIDPKMFYRGYSVDFAPIVSELDVRRTITDQFISDVMLSDESMRDRSELVVLKGHAGAGKSVALKRIAWDSACLFDRLNLVLSPRSTLDYDTLLDLYRLTQERIYLFAEPASDFRDLIEHFLTRAERDKIALTIVTAERFHEWNDQCDNLESYVTRSYSLNYLLPQEIEALLELLTKYKSLGHLQSLPRETQIEELSQRAGRQLLVVLHEATLGKPFSDIVLDEYNSITSPRAKSLYLTICILHRLGVQTRAGLIARVHSISFESFKNEFFDPLEYIVFSAKDDIIRDYYYRARHQHIAELVFERVLITPQDRFDEYMRIVAALDVDYQADHDAMKGLTNARKLVELFGDPSMIRQFYAAARIKDPDNASLLQQEAISEMIRDSGNLTRAEGLLTEAFQMAPYNKAILHSLSELELTRARKADHPVQRQKFLKNAKSLSYKMINSTIDAYRSPYSYHTLIKATFEELVELQQHGDETSIENTMKELEGLLQSAHQRFQDDPFILTTEAGYADLLNNHPRSMKLLQSAFDKNKRNPYIAIRLAKMLDADGRKEQAVSVLKTCLDNNPSDKHVNFLLATYIGRSDNPNTSEVRYYLRRSFTDGDTNYAARFEFARALYVEGEVSEARRYFHELAASKTPPKVKHESRGIVVATSGEPMLYKGQLIRLESDFAFIAIDGTQDRAYAHISLTSTEKWTKLRLGDRISFVLSFNYYGALAQDVTREA